MKVLFFGAGVIGSHYARLFVEAGVDTTIFARGGRLKALQEQGLLYREGEAVKCARPRVIGQLSADDSYDFIFLAVRGHQLPEALQQLAGNRSPTVVTMVNTLMSYDQMEALCGKGRILPAFPGAGGGFREGVLEAALTPAAVQPTTFGEPDGRDSGRLRRLKALFEQAGVLCAVEKDMRSWQLCHLAMVVPVADAYYEAADPARAGWDRAVMGRAARRIQDNLRALKRMGVTITPPKMKGLMRLPRPFARMIFTGMFRGEVGQTFMYPHSMKARDEMDALHEQFYAFLGEGR